MKNKKGVVFGVANEKSIAWAIAQKLHQEGAHIIISYQKSHFEKTIRQLTGSSGNKIDAVICDVSDEEQIQKAQKDIISRLGKIDFIVHSVAFGPRMEFQGRFLDTTREGFRISQEISTYSFTAIIRNFEKYLNDGASLLTITFEGSQRVVPGYNLMGPAKASLETSVRYLAYELGQRQIRVNAISAGPIATSASNWIPDFQDILDHFKQIVPLKRNISQSEVANAAAFLLNDMAAGITGNILYVDAGYHILAP